MVMASTSQLTRVYVEGSMSRFAVYRLTSATSATSVDLSTDFSILASALAVATGATTQQSTLLVSGSTVSCTALTFAPSGNIWFVVTGNGA